MAAPHEVQRIAAAIGFSARPRGGSMEHPATVALLTPQGTVARYFNGVGIEPAELRTALVDASQGRIGTWTDRLAVLCSHFAAATGRHTGTIMGVLRGLSVLTLAGVAGLAWRQARRRKPA